MNALVLSSATRYACCIGVPFRQGGVQATLPVRAQRLPVRYGTAADSPDRRVEHKHDFPMAVPNS